jgi:hypothetical protein
MGRRGRRDGVIARLFYGLCQGFEGQRLERADARRFRGQINVGRGHIGHGRQQPLDAAGTGGAGHALDFEGQGARE